MSHDEASFMAYLREALATDRVLTRPVPARNNISVTNRKRFRKILLEVYGPDCWLCNRRIVDETPTLDHIVPRSLGGRNSIVNVRLSHQRCNSKRGNGPVPELLLTEDMRLDRPQGWQSSPRSKPNGRDGETRLGAKHESGISAENCLITAA